MVTMSSSARPPAGLETKSAPTMLAPTPTAPIPDTATVTPEGVVELIAAVTGIQDDVGDIIRPGAFRRTIGASRFGDVAPDSPGARHPCRCTLTG